MQSEEFLRREGELYGISPDDYVKLSPVLRVSAKSKWMRERRKEAQSKGIDEETFLEASQREILSTLRSEFPGEPPGPSPGGLGSSSAPHQEQNAVPRIPGSSGSPGNEGRGPMGVVPILPAVMARRVNSGAPDLVGDRAPRTLSDIYARWPVGKQEGYYLRVERTQPRFFQNVPCAGYVGDISVEMTEREFGSYFGGREYVIEVYGPDPRKQDVQGAPVIKRLSDPIKLSVPVLPPNMFAGSVSSKAESPQSSGENMYPQHMYPGAIAPPPSQADVQMHRTTLEVVGNMLQKQQEREARFNREQGDVTGNVLKIVSEAGKDQLSLAKEQLAAEREERRRLEEKLSSATNPTVDLVRAFAPNKDAALEQMKSTYESQIANNERLYASMRETAEQRHREELRRSDERFLEIKSRYDSDIGNVRAEAEKQQNALRDQFARDIENARRDYESRERSLREELRDARSELRLDADKRIAELRQASEEKQRDIEKAFERELRAVRESNETRLHVTDQTRQTEIAILREKLAEREQEIAKLQLEVEKLGDPVEQIQAMEAKAQALGYTKSDPSAPSGPWEHLAASVGAGVGQMLGSVGEWGPSILERMQAGAAQRQQMALQQQALMIQAQQMKQLPGNSGPSGPGPGPSGPQEANGRIPPPKRRPVVWATENQALPATPSKEAPPLGVTSAQGLVKVEEGAAEGPLEGAEGMPAPEAPPVAETEAPAAPAAEAPQMGGIELPPEEELAQMMPEMPAKMKASFTMQHVFGFMLAVEDQMKVALPPATFLEHFAAKYPAQARAAYEVGFDTFDAYIQSIPSLEGSMIASRGGQQWLEKLWAAMAKKFA